jgi:hypothetical protein
MHVEEQDHALTIKKDVNVIELDEIVWRLSRRRRLMCVEEQAGDPHLHKAKLKRRGRQC